MVRVIGKVLNDLEKSTLEGESPVKIFLLNKSCHSFLRVNMFGTAYWIFVKDLSLIMEVHFSKV